MTKRPSGRPRLDPDDSSVPITVRLPSKAYDHVYAAAQRHHVTVPEAIRRSLRRLLTSKEDTPAE